MFDPWDEELIRRLQAASIQNADPIQLVKLIQQHFQFASPKRIPTFGYLSRAFDIKLPLLIDCMASWQGFAGGGKVADDEVRENWKLFISSGS